MARRRDTRLDGKLVLTTNTDLPAHEVALTCKSLWRVERTFREEKSTPGAGPIAGHAARPVAPGGRGKECSAKLHRYATILLKTRGVWIRTVENQFERSRDPRTR